jgi:hypothetical protein
MVEAVARVMVVDMVNNKAVAMAANRAAMGGMEKAVMNTVMNTIMNAEMTIHMDSSKAGATAANKEGMVEMANAATSDATTILTGSSKAEVMVEVGVMAEANKAGVMEEGSKAVATAEGSKVVAMAEVNKVVAMVEVNKADMTKVEVVATALKTVLAEDMEGEGISFKKVEDQVKALGVISIPTKL